MTKASTTSPTKVLNVVKAKGSATITKKGTSGNISSVSGPRQNILNSIARLDRFYKGKPPRNQVALLAGYPNSGTAGFKKMLSILKKEGHLLYDSETLWLTEQGMQVAGPVEEDPTNEDFHQAIRETIQVPKYRLAFDFLLDGRARSKTELAEQLGYPDDKTAGFKKMLSQIRKHAFVDSDKTTVFLKDDAFPFGRPAFDIPEVGYISI